MQQGMQHPQQPPPPAGPPTHQQAGHYASSHPIAQVNEAVWLQIGRSLRQHLSLARPLTPLAGSFSELLRLQDEAMHAYERALQANPNSTAAMNAIGMVLKGREQYDKALEFFRAIVQIEPGNGEAWGNLGMKDLPCV